MIARISRMDAEPCSIGARQREHMVAIVSAALAFATAVGHGTWTSRAS